MVSKLVKIIFPFLVILVLTFIMFRYDKNSSDLVLKKGFKFAFNVPKRVSNIVNASSVKSKRIYVWNVLWFVQSIFFILVIFLNFK